MSDNPIHSYRYVSWGIEVRLHHATSSLYVNPQVTAMSCWRAMSVSSRLITGLQPAAFPFRQMPSCSVLIIVSPARIVNKNFGQRSKKKIKTLLLYGLHYGPARKEVKKNRVPHWSQAISPTSFMLGHKLYRRNITITWLP